MALLDETIFQALCKSLSPRTLAQMIVDLEQAQEDWEYYPDEAPSGEMQQTLLGLLPVIQDQGQTLAGQEGLDFGQMVEQTRAARTDEDWVDKRGEQVVQNWMSDFD